jgi:hypothetical protein
MNPTLNEKWFHKKALSIPNYKRLLLRAFVAGTGKLSNQVVIDFLDFVKNG